MIMVEDTSKNVQLEGSFYSDKIYRFHDDANDVPLMNQAGINELGKSIRKHGQQKDIVLIGDLIIDGRNRYLACHNEGITPRFKYYDSNLNTADYVLVENVYRRHLTPTQKTKVVLKHLKIERIKARERKIRTQFNGRTRRNTPKLKGSVCPSEGRTENTQKKGRATQIVAKKLRMSRSTVEKIEKISEIAKENPFIKRYWEKAQEDNLPIEEIYRNIIMALDIHKNRRKNLNQDLNKVEKICEASKTNTCIKEQWEEVKENKRSIEEVSNNVDRIEEVQTTIREESIRKLDEAGTKYLKSKGETVQPKSDNHFIICKQCSKAYAFLYKCFKCGNLVKCDCGEPASWVNCEYDYIKCEPKYRDPNSKLCKNSPDYDLLSRRDF